MSDFSGLSVFPRVSEDWPIILVLLNNRCTSFLLRVITQDLKFAGGYTSRLPLPREVERLGVYGRYAYTAKSKLVALDILEDVFQASKLSDHSLSLATFVHTVEGAMEAAVMGSYQLGAIDAQVVIEETGIPAGWHPLIVGYDDLLSLPVSLDLPPLPEEVLQFMVAHLRTSPGSSDLIRIKANLWTLYEAGPGAKVE